MCKMKKINEKKLKLEIKFNIDRVILYYSRNRDWRSDSGEKSRTRNTNTVSNADVKNETGLLHNATPQIQDVEIFFSFRNGIIVLCA